METYIHCTPSSLSRITHMSLLFLFSNFPLGLSIELASLGLSWNYLSSTYKINNIAKLYKAGVSKNKASHCTRVSSSYSVGTKKYRPKLRIFVDRWNLDAG
jgi:hypothetical protein